jgi:hypothetical protein
MTALALNYSQSLFNGLWRVLKKSIQGIMIGYMIARQTQANHHVAQLLINSGEYRQQDYYNLVHQLNQKTIESIHEKYND